MSSPVSSPIEISSQMVDFRPLINAYPLLNRNNHPVTTLFVGNMMTLPAANEVHPHKAELDADGDPIPGSYLVSDIYTFINELDDNVLTFDAKRAVAHILGLQRISGGTTGPVSASSPYAQSGISLLPRNPTKEVWQAVAKDADERVFMKSIDRAYKTISEYDEKNAKRVAAGMAPVPGGKDYDRALFLVNQYNNLQKKSVDEQLSPLTAAVSEETALEEIETQAWIEAEVMKIAKGISEKSNVDEHELAKRLLNNPTIVAKLRKDGFRIRKRGHMEQRASAEDVLKDSDSE